MITTLLGGMKKGQKGRVIGFVAGVDKAYRARLLALGLTKGAQIIVERFAPLGDPVQISLRGAYISLRKAEANSVEIRIDE